MANCVHYDKMSSDGKWLSSWYENGSQFLSLSGCRWFGMKARVKENGYYQSKFPTYIGSKTTFCDFNSFVEWSREEVGYDSISTGGRIWSLDKDILSQGSKVYSTETCLFVPDSVNNFFKIYSNKKSNLHLGVVWDKRANKYRVKMADVNFL